MPRLRRADDRGGARPRPRRALRLGLVYNPSASDVRQGGGNTHAWVRIFLPGSGWVEYDPTNGIVGNRGLIRVAIARELDHFAECVRSGKTPRTPGEEGLQDQIIMEAIYAAAKTGRTVTLPAVAKRDAFRGPELEGEG